MHSAGAAGLSCIVVRPGDLGFWVQDSKMNSPFSPTSPSITPSFFHSSGVPRISLWGTNLTIGADSMPKPVGATPLFSPPRVFGRGAISFLFYFVFKLLMYVWRITRSYAVYARTPRTTVAVPTLAVVSK